jgi:hypothetical protein
MAMALPAAELQKAVLQALGGDAGLIDMLGGARIHEIARSNAPLPHITFGRTGVYDWSTGAESDTEQLFTLHVWSKARDSAETQEIMRLARARLDGQMLPLEGEAAVGMRLEFSEVRYDENLAIHHGMLRFRAVIEARQE